MPGTARIDFSSDDQKAIAGLQRMIQKQEEVIGKLREQNREARKSTQETDAFSGALAKVGTAVGGLFTVAAAWQKIGESIRFANQQREQGARGLESERELRGKIATISASQEEFDAAIAAATEFGRFGISRQQGLDQVFTGLSQGFSIDEIRASGRLRNVGASPQAFLTGLAGIRLNLGEDVLGGTVQGFSNAALRASASANVGPNEIASAALQSAASFKGLGGSAEELLAATALSSGAFKSTEVGATRVNAVAALLSRDDRFRGKGLLGSLRELEAGGESFQRRVFGSNIEATQGASVLLENLDFLESEIGGIREAVAATGTEASPFRRAERIALGDRGAAAAATSEGFRAQRESLQRDVLGPEQLARQAIRDAVQAELLRRGEDPSFVLDTVFSGGAALGGGVEGLARVAAQNLFPNRGEPGFPSGDVLSQRREFVESLNLESILREQTSELKKISGDAGTIVKPNPAGAIE